MLVNGVSTEEGVKSSHAESAEKRELDGGEGEFDAEVLSERKSNGVSLSEKVENTSAPEKRKHQIQIWTEIRPSLKAIEEMMGIRIKKKGGIPNGERDAGKFKPLPSEDAKFSKVVSEEDSEDEFYDAERTDPVQDTSVESLNASTAGPTNAVFTESSFPWKEELEVLVRGGVPMALRGEVHAL